MTESNAAPRRTAQFAADGTVKREWYGGQRWAPHAAFEGDNPNVLWVGSQYGWIMRVLADYKSQTWTVHSCYRYTDLADGLVGDSHNEGGYFRAYRHDGITYLALEKLPTILKVDEKNWQLLPVTVCGAVSSTPQFIKDWAQTNQSYQWNDANSDGRPQQDEFTFYAEGIANSYEPTIAPDFSCFTVVDHVPARQVHKFPVERWNQAGAPVYGSMPQEPYSALVRSALIRLTLPTSAGPPSCARTRARAGCLPRSTIGRATGATTTTRSCNSGPPLACRLGLWAKEPWASRCPAR